MDEKLRELLFEIRDSLNKIEGLLYEPKRNNLTNPITHYHYYTGVDYTPVVPQCNCGTRTSGSYTGGWFCPVHGQVF